MEPIKTQHSPMANELNCEGVVPTQEKDQWSRELREYSYSHLSISPREIRTITILPGRNSDLIRCHLAHRELVTEVTDNLEFTALSYTWGHSRDQHPILMNGCKFYVTTNLHEFMKHVRQERESPPYWIDAICINQKDIEERNRHVRFMREVYERAKSVVIWLGPAADHSHLALKTLEGMQEVYMATKRMQERNKEIASYPPFMQSSLLFQFADSAWVRDRELQDAMFDEVKLFSAALTTAAPLNANPNLEFAEMAGDALKSLFKRAWWERMWIVQEIAVRTKDTFLMCGKDIISWEACQDASTVSVRFSSTLKSRHIVSKIPFFTIDKLFRIQRAQRDRESPQMKESLSLAALCKNFMHFKSTDNRDRVYALLGLAEDIDLTKYRVDYNMKSIDVFVHMTRYLIETHKNLDIFGYCTYPSWISWCPHWTWGYVPTEPLHKTHFGGKYASIDAVYTTHDGRRAYVYHPLMSAYDRKQNRLEGRVGVLEDAKVQPAYSTSDGTEPVIEFLDDKFQPISGSTPKIKLKGFIVDIVQGQPLPATNPEIPFVQAERTVWEEAALAAGDTYITGESMLAAFRRTLRADIATQNDGVPRRGGTVVWDESEFNFDDDSGDEYDDGSLVKYYISHAQSNCRSTTRGRSFFRTSRGYMGVTTEGVSEGDLICVLFGGQVPYCLQRQDDEEYKLVGECYCHGIMDGEAMKDLSEGKYTARDFILR
jgi:hypothetical protein